MQSRVQPWGNNPSGDFSHFTFTHCSHYSCESYVWLLLWHHEVTSHLLWQSDHCSMLCLGGDPVREVLTTGSEHWAVGSETLTLHHYCNITQRVPATLLVQATQHMGGMCCRLKCKHRWPGGRHGHQGHLYVHINTNNQLLFLYQDTHLDRLWQFQKSNITFIRYTFK